MLIPRNVQRIIRAADWIIWIVYTAPVVRARSNLQQAFYFIQICEIQETQYNYIEDIQMILLNMAIMKETSV